MYSAHYTLQVVVAHDQHLLRLTGEDVMIRDRNFTDLPR